MTKRAEGPYTTLRFTKCLPGWTAQNKFTYSRFNVILENLPSPPEKSSPLHQLPSARPTRLRKLRARLLSLQSNQVIAQGLSLDPRDVREAQHS